MEQYIKEKELETASLTDSKTTARVEALIRLVEGIDKVPEVYERNDWIDYTETTRTTPNGTVVKTTRISLYPKHDENRVYNLHPDKLIFM